MDQTIQQDQRNYRIHGDKNKELIKKSLKDLGAGRSILLDKDNVIIAGNGVHAEAEQLGLKVKIIETDGTELIAVKRTDLSTEDEKRKLLAVADNKTSDTSEFDFELLSADFEIDILEEIGFDLDELTFESIEKEEKPSDTLTERFLVPPFSILDTKQSYWINRKAAWDALGFNSQSSREGVELMAASAQNPEVYALRNDMRKSLGREPSWDEVNDLAKKRGLRVFEGASVFDPVLAELSYLWFCPKGGTIIDPFAGGSVRGIVANYLDYTYTGIDLRQDQVSANIEQAGSIVPDKIPTWIVGDSNKVLDSIEDKFDFVYSCPPYHDLEQYSKDEADLSNMDYDEFKEVYSSIIAKAVDKLKDNRFACFVVSEIRDKVGFYKNFVQDTIHAFEAAGAMYYNEIVLVNQLGSLPIRVTKQFNSGRKVGRTHQNVLVFFKGDPKTIKNEFGEVDFSNIDL